MDKHYISKLFQNEKIGEIFANSDGGQGLIVIEIENKLLISEVISITELNHEYLLSIAESNKDEFPRVSSFIKKVLKTIGEIYIDFENMSSDEFVVSLINQNKHTILNHFKEENNKKSIECFLNLYYKENELLKNQPFSVAKRFIKTPIEHVLSIS